jgi:hypothetical protein
MEEFKNVWVPVTEEYKTVEAPSLEPQHEKIEQLYKERLEQAKKQAKADRAPLGVRIFTGYFLLMAGVGAILLYVMLAYPDSRVSTSIAGKLGHSASQSSQQANEGEKTQQNLAVDGGTVGAGTTDVDSTGHNMSKMRSVALFDITLEMFVNAVIGVLLLMRHRLARLGVKLIARLYVGRAIIFFAAYGYCGGKILIPQKNIPIVLVSLLVNYAINLYFEYDPKVKKAFEHGLYS